MVDHTVPLGRTNSLPPDHPLLPDRSPSQDHTRPSHHSTPPQLFIQVPQNSRFQIPQSHFQDSPPVPDLSTTLGTLKEAPQFTSPQFTSPTVSDASFESISQVPTPIINNGSFGALSPVDSGLEYPKTRRTTSTKPQKPPRIVSEYKPIDRADFVPQPHRVSSVPGPSEKTLGHSLRTLSEESRQEEDVERFWKHQMFFSAKFDAWFKFVKIIGSGSFSLVVLVHDVDDDRRQAAIKIISIPMNNKAQIKNFKYFLRRELSILHQLHHKNVIRLLDYNISLDLDLRGWDEGPGDESDQDHQDMARELSNSSSIKDLASLQQNNHQLLFLNYCPGGNLYEFSVRTFKTWNQDVRYWRAVVQIVRELVVAVDYIHTNNIVHRDIKLENVLLNYTLDELMEEPHLEGITCLTDFGLAKKLSSSSQMLSTRCGSQDYVAPEILMGLKYNGVLTDSWAVGVVIYCLVENRLPFDLPSYDDMAQTGISPSVIKRRMAKNSPAHRIAMIDWDWYTASDLVANASDEMSSLIRGLQSAVDVLLVRKERRKSVSEMLVSPGFEWVRRPL